ncbi:MAG: hypothetical protein HQM08_28815 [Candidatus Riflebacteria bacterium]|nr:hypothetical protein [Candidatus Riflebacteria bacterium]
MAEFEISFEVELLEDLHSGSGIGKLGLIDDLHARDSRGNPVVWNSTIAGLLRERAEELRFLETSIFSGKEQTGSKNCLGAFEERLVRLWGKEGSGGRSSLICRSLHFLSELRDLPLQEFPVFHEIVSTSREVHSRRPMEQSLRIIEVASAGLKAKGLLRFEGDEKDKEFIILCLKRLTNIGGGKSRGLGQIAVRNIKDSLLSGRSTQEKTKVNSKRLRFVLKTLEPVCIPDSSYAGNLIETKTFIPGQVIRGALLTALNSFDEKLANELARTEAVHFLNGYFVPPRFVGDDEVLRNFEVFPIPLSAMSKKATKNPGNIPSNIPWWAALDAQKPEWVSDKNGPECDFLLEKPPSGGNFKRIKSEDSIVFSKNVFYRSRPVLLTTLRNQVPVKRMGYHLDSRCPTENPGNKSGTEETIGSLVDKNSSFETGFKEFDNKGELFSVSSMNEEQYFVFDVVFSDSETAGNFINGADRWLSGPSETRSWLRLGRGGRPACIEKWVELSEKNLDNSKFSKTPEEVARIVLTLTSDLIARAEDLGFMTSLDFGTLCRLAGCDYFSGSVEISNSVSEPVIIHGFNTAAGARRAAVAGIRRGSAFSITSKEKEKLADLFLKLDQLQKSGKGLGERQEEGYGRFVLNHKFHNFQKVENSVDHSDQVVQSNLPNEAVLKKVLEYVKTPNFEKLYSPSKEKLPSRSQWQAFRHGMEAAKEMADIEKIFEKLMKSSDHIGGKPWKEKPLFNKPLITALSEKRTNVGDFVQQRLFFIHLARWIAIQIDNMGNKHAEEAVDGRN